MTPSEAIATLKRLGRTESAIGAAVGARQSTINRILHGVMQPSYDVGKALVDLAEAARLQALNADATQLDSAA
jgi:predicted transcriptional regulator